MSKEDLIKQAKQVIVEGDEDAAREMAKKVIEEGIDPLEIINKGFTPAMVEVQIETDEKARFADHLTLWVGHT